MWVRSFGTFDTQRRLWGGVRTWNRSWRISHIYRAYSVPHSPLRIFTVFTSLAFPSLCEDEPPWVSIGITQARPKAGIHSPVYHMTWINVGFIMWPINSPLPLNLQHKTLLVYVSNTYDHRKWKTELPVRSAVLKPLAGRLVVGWVTTSESRLSYVFFFVCSLNSYCLPPEYTVREATRIRRAANASLFEAAQSYRSYYYLLSWSWLATEYVSKLIGVDRWYYYSAFITYSSISTSPKRLLNDSWTIFGDVDKTQYRILILYRSILLPAPRIYI